MNKLLKMTLLFSAVFDIVILFISGQLWIKIFALTTLLLLGVSIFYERREMRR